MSIASVGFRPRTTPLSSTDHERLYAAATTAAADLGVHDGAAIAARLMAMADHYGVYDLVDRYQGRIVVTMDAEDGA